MVQINDVHIASDRKKSNRSRSSVGLIIACLLALNSPTNGETVSSRGTGTPLDAADRAFMALRYEEADSLYNCLAASKPESADLYWKLARLNISIAESMSPDDKSGKMPHYTKAVEYAQKAVQLDNNNASAHTWLAAALALKADKLGAKEKVRRAAEIKKELDKALGLNPKDDVAWSMLGSYHAQVSHIGWFNRFMGNTFIGDMPQGNIEEAEKEFRKAISLNPRVIRHYHELANILLENGRKKEALNILRAAETKPVLMKSDIRRLEQIRKLVRKLSKEVENN